VDGGRGAGGVAWASRDAEVNLSNTINSSTSTRPVTSLPWPACSSPSLYHSPSLPIIPQSTPVQIRHSSDPLATPHHSLSLHHSPTPSRHVTPMTRLVLPITPITLSLPNHHLSSHVTPMTRLLLPITPHHSITPQTTPIQTRHSLDPLAPPHHSISPSLYHSPIITRPVTSLPWPSCSSPSLPITYKPLFLNMHV